MRARHSVNEGFGKDFYRQVNSVKRFWPFSEPPDSENWILLCSSHSQISWELRNIYHHHPESKKRKSSEANSGSIHPYGRYGNAVKTRKAISTIAILWPVKTIFEKRATTVEVDSFVSPDLGSWTRPKMNSPSSSQNWPSMPQNAPKKVKFTRFLPCWRLFGAAPLLEPKNPSRRFFEITSRGKNITSKYWIEPRLLSLYACFQGYFGRVFKRNEK